MLAQLYHPFIALQEEQFPGTPAPLRPDQADLVLSKVQQLLDVFIDRGFCIKVLHAFLLSSFATLLSI